MYIELKSENHLAVACPETIKISLVNSCKQVNFIFQI